MTQNQFERAVAISERLQSLEAVKKEIEKKSGRRLSYCYRTSGGDYREISEFTLRHIAKYLDKYDNQIRKDIDNEIESLHKEIEEL